MRLAKSLGLLILWAHLLSSLNAASYITGFDAPAILPFDVPDPTPVLPDVSQLAGQDGWSSPDANMVSFIGLMDYPGASQDGLGDPVPQAGSRAGAIGGLFDIPSLATTNVNHGYGDPFQGTTFEVLFRVEESVDFAGDDSFGWSFLNAGDPRLSIAFEDATGGSGDLEIAWYDDFGTRFQVAGSPGSALFYGDAYTLDVSFSASGSDTSFSATITGDTDSVTFGGTLTGVDPTSSLDTFQADYIVPSGTAADAGDNYMIFDNLSIIPEPAVPGMLLLTLSLMVARRRR